LNRKVIYLIAAVERHDGYADVPPRSIDDEIECELAVYGTLSRIAIGYGSVGTGSIVRSQFKRATTGCTFRRQYLPAHYPSLHMSLMHGTSMWKLYSRCAERCGQT